jgi:hypothetical protein
MKAPLPLWVYPAIEKRFGSFSFVAADAPYLALISLRRTSQDGWKNSLPTGCNLKVMAKRNLQMIFPSIRCACR